MVVRKLNDTFVSDNCQGCEDATDYINGRKTLGRLFSGLSAFFVIGMNTSFQRFALKDMFDTATYSGKDNGGNHWYRMKWLLSKFSSNDIYQTDFDMSSPSGKALALRVVQPFAMVVDRCGSMMRNGKFYVVDKNDNEKPRYKDIENLLARPNVIQSGKAFLKQVEIYLKAFGFCPIFALRATKKDLPKVMVVIPPELFHVEGKGNIFRENSKDEIINKVYIQWGDSKLELFEEDYILIYDSIANYPTKEGDEISFYSPVDTLSPHTRNYMSQIIGRGNLIVNGGPKGILYGDDTSDTGNAALTPKEADSLMDRFKRKFGIVNKLYEVMVTNKKVGWINVGSNTQDLMLHEEGQACLNEIANTIGLQPDLFSQGATFDNKEAAKKAAYQDLIIPDSELICQALTESICPEGVFIKLDFSHVSCLQEDKAKNAQSLSSAAAAVSGLVNLGLLTIDEARIELANYIDIDPENPKGEYKQASVTLNEEKEVKDEV